MTRASDVTYMGEPFASHRRGIHAAAGGAAPQWLLGCSRMRHKNNIIIVVYSYNNIIT